VERDLQSGSAVTAVLIITAVPLVFGTGKDLHQVTRKMMEIPQRTRYANKIAIL